MGKYTANMKKTRKILVISLVLAALALLLLLSGVFGTNSPAEADVLETTKQEQDIAQVTEPAETEAVISMPWEEAGAKKPAEYTWEEYESLTGIQRKEFRAYLGDDVFAQWLNNMREHAEVKPWDELGAKQPEEYSWEEYEALPLTQQVAFQKYLGLDAFEAWLICVQSQMEKNPWDESGAKQPAEYTWEEFEALTAAQQMAFQFHLKVDGFGKWLNAVQNQDIVTPWQTSGAKQPADYTWEEFEALTAGQQMAFQNWLGMEGFDQWLNAVQNQSELNPWEKAGAKQPADYTWAEFEALTAGQQMAFQNYLGAEEFDQWINAVQNQGEPNPWEKAGAKQPADYTWAEFEALTPGQQIAFQNHLGADSFEEWINKVQG